VHVKLQYNDEYRRFFITRSTKFIELVEKIKSILNLKEEFHLKYKDEEEEWITISSDMELETGLIIGNGLLFRIQIVLVSTLSEVKELPTTETDAPFDYENRRWRKHGGRGGRGCRGKRYRKWKNEEGGEEEDCKGKRYGRWRNEEGGEDDCKGKRYRRWRNEKDGEDDCKGKDGEGEEEGLDNEKPWCHGKKWKKHQKKMEKMAK